MTGKTREYIKNLGDKIKTHRKAKGLSLDSLAKMTNTSKSYIWELENKKHNNPTADKLIKISQALDVTIDYLLKTRIDEKKELMCSKSDIPIDALCFITIKGKKYKKYKLTLVK